MLLRPRRQLQLALALALAGALLLAAYSLNFSARDAASGPQYWPAFSDSRHTTPAQGEKIELDFDFELDIDSSLDAKNVSGAIDNYVQNYISSRLDYIFESGDFNSNWKLFTALHFDKVHTDPFYYQKQRKDFHLYDPRITMAVYLNRIAQKAQETHSSDYVSIPFSWQDWVDLSCLNDFLVWEETQRPTCEDVIDHGIFYDPLKAVVEPNHNIHESFCVDSVNYHGHVNRHLLPGFAMTNDAGEHFNFLEKRIQSKSFLLSTMKQPEKLVFLTDDDDIFEVYVEKNHHETMMENGLFDDFVSSKRSGSKGRKDIHFNPQDELKHMSKSLTPIEPEFYFKNLLNETNLFTFDVPSSKWKRQKKPPLGYSRRHV